MREVSGSSWIVLADAVRCRLVFASPPCPNAFRKQKVDAI